MSMSSLFRFCLFHILWLLDGWLAPPLPFITSSTWLSPLWGRLLFLIYFGHPDSQPSLVSVLRPELFLSFRCNRHLEPFMCMVTAQAPKEVKGKQLSGKVSGKPQSLISEGHGKFSGNRGFSRCLPCSLPVVPLQIKVVDDYHGMQSEVESGNGNER